MNSNPITDVLIIAGEASGDLHGASLMLEMQKINSNLTFYGIGGNNMRNAGLNLSFHIDKMAFLGFVEVVKHLPFIKKVQRELLAFVTEKQIKNVILIDYPGFNLSLAKKLKPLGVKLFYYISPQLWAWGKGRIHKIKKLVDVMLVLFPFEEKLYKEYGINVTFVGHPLIHQLDEYKFMEKEELYNKYELDLSKEILLILPGSRKQEVEKIFPLSIKGAILTAQKFNMQIVVACANSIDEEVFYSLTNERDFKVIKNATYDLVKYSKFGIVKSGTSTLEAALMGLPMIIVYKANRLTYLIGKLLVKLKHIGLANIVAGKSIVPELIQNDVNEKSIFTASRIILSDSGMYEKIRAELLTLRSKLGEKQASTEAAKIVTGSLK